MNFSEWIPAVIAALFSGVLSSIATAMLTRRPALVTAEAARITAEAKAQDTINGGFAELAAELSKQLREARSEITSLRGEIASLAQHMQSLEGILRAHDIPIPPNLRPAPLTLVTGAQ